METKQGFAGIAALVVIVAAIIISGAYLLTKNKVETPAVTNIPVATSTSPTLLVSVATILRTCTYQAEKITCNAD